VKNPLRPTFGTKRSPIITTLLLRLASICSAVVFLSIVYPATGGFSEDAAPHRARQTEFGVSGGNADDEDKKFCCSGTLGSLVTAEGNLYILSNNHVLADSDQGQPGDPITQPGLIDTNCEPATVVANLSTFVPLTSGTVDAAIAQLVPGTMDTSGTILDIGQISSIVAAPSIGQKVEKSGRTTGLTTSKVEAINTDVKISYQQQCNKGPSFNVIYDNQVMVRGAKFSGAGDSGSLIVTSNDCHQPVALLFAGNSTSTVGNPIQDVLSALGVSFVGTSADCSAVEQSSALSGAIPQDSLAQALAVKTRHRNSLMSLASVLGVGISASDADPTRAAIIVYVDQTASARPSIPAELDGVPVQVRLTDPFVAL
jgi:hypothetical protein